MNNISIKIGDVDTIIKSVLGIIVLFVLFYTIYSFIHFSQRNQVLIANNFSTKKELKFNKNRLRVSDIDKGISWSFVTWLFINDWNYKFGHKKSILNWSNKNSGLEVYFDELTNNLIIEITTIPYNKKEKLIYDNIPLQKWFNMTIILDNRNLDLFIDGSLVQTLHLKYIPFYDINPLILFDKGGFDGYIAYMQYMNYKIPKYAIDHFQLLDKKLNSKRSFISIIPSYFYFILFLIKNYLLIFLTLINRMFQNLNKYSYEFILNIFKQIIIFLKKFANTFYEIITSFL